MRDELKTLLSNQIILEDNSQFYYMIKPFEMTNALGHIVAILQEYYFIKKEDTTEPFFCKLYRTKEGNWYEIEESKINTQKGIFRMLKSAFDTEENNTVLD
jgi:hypothetical protein